ncbi:MAG: carbohydrate binding domain-containing protein [Armatimonadota bacterium]|nr:carbohydrate binding domain-containing protein [bacterium]
MITLRKDHRSSFTAALKPIVAGIALSLVLGVSAAVANIMPDYSFESATAGTTITATGMTNVCSNIRFYNGGTGTLQVVSGAAAQDGNVALKLSKTTESDSVFIDMDAAPTDSWIPVTAGQSYEVSFWARSDSDSWFVFEERGYSDWTPIATNYTGWVLNSAWTEYTSTWIAPTSVTKLDLAWNLGKGSMVLDNVCVQAVPEPASMLAMFGGFVGFVGLAIRRKK